MVSVHVKHHIYLLTYLPKAIFQSGDWLSSLLKKEKKKKGEGLIGCKNMAMNAAIVRLAFCACDVTNKVGMRGRSVQFCLGMSQAFSDFHWHELLRSEELKFEAKPTNKQTIIRTFIELIEQLNEPANGNMCIFYTFSGQSNSNVLYCHIKLAFLFTF